MKTLLAFLAMIACFGSVSGEPTESRDWRSTTGTSIRAEAIEVWNSVVTLRKSDGTTLKVPLDKLTPQDQELLHKRFERQKTGPTTGAAASFVTGGQAQPIGRITGPIKTETGSSYFVYLPKTLRPGRKAPLLHFNGASGGKADSLKPYLEGAEINGWILAACVESTNSNSFEKNHEHAKQCVAHLLESLPIDANRVYFTGASGGGAMSYYNAARIRSAGAIPMNGYIPDGTKLKGGHYFICNGATDWNRYRSGRAALAIGKNAIHRFYPGAHVLAPPWILADGIAWLNGRYLEAHAQDRNLDDERRDYEAAMLSWIDTFRSKEAHRAFYWCRFLTDEYKLRGSSAAAVQSISRALAADPMNARYADGIKAIDQFSRREYATFVFSGTADGKTSERIIRAGERLAKEFAGVPIIEETVLHMGDKTASD